MNILKKNRAIPDFGDIFWWIGPRKRFFRAQLLEKRIQQPPILSTILPINTGYFSLDQSGKIGQMAKLHLS
ncbi:MAG: hypothetical protein AAGB24_14425 [Bacteroidota bacterium]